MEKILITSGCSFSECKGAETWPKWLSQQLGSSYAGVHKGMGSQGQGMISRSVIYAVSQALKQYKPEDILVGVMWSGPDRHEYYMQNSEKINWFKDPAYYEGWMENPTAFIEDTPKNWVIMNQGWMKVPTIRTYYQYFWDKTYMQIQTYEHMLRLQWFLQSLGIKYFFTCYTDFVMYPHVYKHNQDTAHLYELIDHDKFLPVSSIYTWLVDNQVQLDYLVHPHPHNHPSGYQHDQFVQRVIMPWLRERNYL